MIVMISPIGTSILSHSNELRGLITKYSNHQQSDHFIPEDKIRIDNHIADISNQLLHSELNEAKEFSAELHSIIEYYSNELKGHNQDTHYLVPSDTYIGKKVAEIILLYLRQFFQNVCLLEIKGLQTKSLLEFQYALTDLAKSIFEIADTMKAPQKLIFNLTGGFKSVQGFLQTIGSYYADESIYIFEKSNQLLRIPRLPIKIVPDEVILKNLNTIRRIKLELPVPEEDIVQIPETLVMKCDDLIMMSVWGEIVWDNIKKLLYMKEVYLPPTAKVYYGQNFEKSLTGLSPDRIYNINVRFDQLAQYLESNQKQFQKALNFHSITKNPKQPQSSHEFYAWSDSGASRIYCHFDQAKILILDVLGEHL